MNVQALCRLAAGIITINNLAMIIPMEDVNGLAGIITINNLVVVKRQCVWRKRTPECVEDPPTPSESVFGTRITIIAVVTAGGAAAAEVVVPQQRLALLTPRLIVPRINLVAVVLYLRTFPPPRGITTRQGVKSLKIYAWCV